MSGETERWYQILILFGRNMFVVSEICCCSRQYLTAGCLSESGAQRFTGEMS